jgi:hypothetical protein
MRSSTSITLLFVTSFLAVFGFEAFNQREDDNASRDGDFDLYSSTQPYYRPGGSSYYYNSEYHHWWYFGSSWHGDGVSGSSSISHSGHSGTSRGGFGAHGHGSGS